MISSRGRFVTGAIASMAFITRLMSTCCSWIRSARTTGTSSDSCRSSDTSLAITWARTSGTTSSINVLTFTGDLLGAVFVASWRTRWRTSAAR